MIITHVEMKGLKLRFPNQCQCMHCAGISSSWEFHANLKVRQICIYGFYRNWIIRELDARRWYKRTCRKDLVSLEATEYSTSAVLCSDSLFKKKYCSNISKFLNKIRRKQFVFHFITVIYSYTYNNIIEWFRNSVDNQFHWRLHWENYIGSSIRLEINCSQSWIIFIACRFVSLLSDQNESATGYSLGFDVIPGIQFMYGPNISIFTWMDEWQAIRYCITWQQWNQWYVEVIFVCSSKQNSALKSHCIP